MDKNIRKSLKLLADYKLLIALAFICAIAASVMNVITPQKIGNIADIIKDGLSTQIDFDALKQTSLIGGVIVFVGFLFAFGREFITETVSQVMTRDLRIKISDKLERLPIRTIDTISPGDLISRSTEDISIFTKAFVTNLGDILANTILIIGSFVMMVYSSWFLAIFVIIAIVLGIVVNRILANKSSPRYLRQRSALGEINTRIEESLTGFLVVKSFHCEDEIREDFRQRNEELCEVSRKARFFSGLMMPVMVFSGNFAYVVVCFTGAFMMFRGWNGVTFGTIAAFILYVRMLSSPLSKIAKSVSQMQPAFAASVRIFEILDAQERNDDKGIKLEDVKGEVCFDHVGFGYLPDQPVIHDFTAKVEPGMKVAIVGPTGAGKSTMVNLLMRFYDTDKGSIKIDGIPVNEISEKSLHDCLGMVLQETWTFTGTIRDNLVFSTPDVTDEKLDDVVRKTGLSHLIATLPDGVDTVISEQSCLSSGQIQLITIARVMLKDPQILILDEATSSVDTRTEILIQKAIDSLTEGRTSFVIAHRLSTILNADMILVMKDGDVVEIGKHHDLLSKGGLYAEIYNSQFDEDGDKAI